jgi:hypothetical protein
VAGLIGLVAMPLAGCQKLPTGPTLERIQLSGIQLQPTTTDDTLCCCHVKATTLNTNDVAVHLTIVFAAFDDVSTEPLQRIVHFVKDLQPNTPTPIEAPGFLLPCSAIKQLKTEVTVRGVAFPPL